MGARKNVRRLAAILDVEYPGWESKVRVNSLDLDMFTRCILGQVTGAYTTSNARRLFDLAGLAEGIGDREKEKFPEFSDPAHKDLWLAEIDARINTDYNEFSAAVDALKAAKATVRYLKRRVKELEDPR